MTDFILDLLTPPTIDLRAYEGGPLIATLPGELPVEGEFGALQLTRIFAEAHEHEQFLLDTPDTSENAAAIAEAQDGLRSFYEQAAKLLQQHATMAKKSALLELTATQIVSIVSVLVAPPMRLQLLSNAFMMVMGLEIGEDGQAVPLAEGSSATSSRSAASTSGRRRTGGKSRGRSSSPTARTRSTVKK